MIEVQAELPKGGVPIIGAPAGTVVFYAIEDRVMRGVIGANGKMTIPFVNLDEDVLRDYFNNPEAPDGHELWSFRGDGGFAMAMLVYAETPAWMERSVLARIPLFCGRLAEGGRREDGLLYTYRAEWPKEDFSYQHFTNTLDEFGIRYVCRVENGVRSVLFFKAWQPFVERVGLAVCNPRGIAKLELKTV